MAFNIKKQANLNFKKNTTFKIPRTPFLPSSLGGLALWLKADTGTTSTTFISEIEISGAGEGSSDGTYVRSSGGNTTFYLNSNEIYFSGGNWLLYDDSYGDVTYVNLGSSLDPNNWIEENASGAPSAVNTTITAVTAWADQSGSGNNATAIDTPTLSTVIGKTFMNFAGGYFYGYELLTEQQVTIMCVARFSSLRDIEMIFSQIAGDDSLNMLLYRGFDLDSGYRIYNGLNLSSDSLTNNNQTYLFGGIFNGESGALFLNGVANGADEIGNIAPEGNYYLGAWGGAEQDPPLTPTEMKMAEIVVYDRVLTTPEREQVEEYLNTKYLIY